MASIQCEILHLMVKIRIFLFLKKSNVLEVEIDKNRPEILEVNMGCSQIMDLVSTLGTFGVNRYKGVFKTNDLCKILNIMSRKMLTQRQIMIRSSEPLFLNFC
jgi:hypothetical protein